MHCLRNLLFLLVGVKQTTDFVDRGLSSSPLAGLQSLQHITFLYYTAPAYSSNTAASTLLKPSFNSSITHSFQLSEMERHTMIEDAPQVSIRRAPPEALFAHSKITSPMTDDCPTPRAKVDRPPVDVRPSSPASSDTQSENSSTWSKRSSQSEFDEMYDMTGSESEGDVPIKLSTSVKKFMASRHKRPSVVIPSPSEWPTIEKLKVVATPLSPPIKIDIAPSVLAQIRQNNLRIPSTSSTPSLDGNTSEEDPALSSCPSTPDSALRRRNWEAPIQLDPASIFLLEQISGEDHVEQSQTVLEMPEEAISEMKQIVKSPSAPTKMKLRTLDIPVVQPNESCDELSALSVPSPGGFFASLNSSVARQTWTAASQAPTTSTATEFYGVPFRFSQPISLPTSTATFFYNVPWVEESEKPIEQTVSFGNVFATEDPITARKVGFSPTDVVHDVDEMNATDSCATENSAAATFDRTQLWLQFQDDYMKAVCEDQGLESLEDVSNVAPKTPDGASPVSDGSSPSKKSVRFADMKQPVDAKVKRTSPIHDGTFWQGWQHQKRSQRARDVFQHRQARAEAEHVRRTSCSKQHADQLSGKFEITRADRPTASRPFSSFLPQAAEDEMKEIIQQAERERQALDQMSHSSWSISAQTELNGGVLLTSPIVQTFKGRADVKVLDLAGQVHCSWAWNVALEHPDAEIHTTVSSDAEAHVAESRLEGPPNHFVVAAPKVWELPFGDGEFDVISARNLYVHLKTTWPKGQAADEWDLTLRECFRCLKPGGYLEFDLLDAEMLHAETAMQALGVEFAFNLKTRGYDPSAGKSFLPRLKRAGFTSIKRAWMVLPVADVVPRWVDSGKNLIESAPVGQGESPALGSTKDVRAITGLVGARMWEQWMLKLNGEMGRSDERCLEGVAEALAEGGLGNAGWRCLVGWARKDVDSS